MICIDVHCIMIKSDTSLVFKYVLSFYIYVYGFVKDIYCTCKFNCIHQVIFRQQFWGRQMYSSIQCSLDIDIRQQ